MGTHLETHLDDVGATGPTAMDLAHVGIDPLDFIALRGFGAYQEGSASEDTAGHTLAVFAGLDGLLTASGTDDVGTTVCFEDDWSSNDVSEDFLVSGERVQVVQVPEAATEILFGPHDCFFQDNSDPDIDYGVLLAR